MDNDDFVSPPPGVHKAGSKEGVADEGPISKSKDGSEVKQNLQRIQPVD